MSTAASPDRKRNLRLIADAYFDGLTNKDLTPVLYADDVVFITPLSPGRQLHGRTEVLRFFAGIYDALDAVHVVDHFYNDDLTAISVQARIRMKAGATLNVLDVFQIDAAGKITAQENHFDPRPALA